MPKYKLMYLQAEARAEVSRLIFAAAGQEYEDFRVHEFTENDYTKCVTMKEEDLKHTDEWSALKKTVPFGHLPVLEVDGQVMFQSKVIQTFLARRFGLAGSTDFEDAKAAAVVESCEEIFMSAVYGFLIEQDKAKQAERVGKYATETMPSGMEQLEKLAGENGYFVGDKLSYADIAFWFNTTWPTRLLKIEIDWTKYPRLKGVVDHVLANPGIAKWQKEKPNCVF